MFARSTGGSFMARLIPAIFIVALLTGWTDLRGTVRVGRAGADSAYDFVVHVSNKAAIKYNPDVREDRYRMALALVRGECPGARVAGDRKIDTGIWGITSSPPDYVVLVRCGRY
jgi:hypothetical protein